MCMHSAMYIHVCVWLCTCCPTHVVVICFRYNLSHRPYCYLCSLCFGKNCYVSKTEKKTQRKRRRAPNINCPRIFMHTNPMNDQLNSWLFFLLLVLNYNAFQTLHLHCTLCSPLAVIGGSRRFVHVCLSLPLYPTLLVANCPCLG